jgi:hypothetical protein
MLQHTHAHGTDGVNKQIKPTTAQWWLVLLHVSAELLSHHLGVVFIDMSSVQRVTEW